MSRAATLLLCLLLLCAGALPHRAEAAEEAVWSGLLYATNVSNPAPAPAEIAGFAPKLQHIFGYNQFQLLGQHRERMDKPVETWLLPGSGVSLVVNTKKTRDNYLLDLQLFQGERSAVRTMVLLARQSPIFLKGPLYSEGQLIIVLKVE